MPGVSHPSAGFVLQSSHPGLQLQVGLQGWHIALMPSCGLFVGSWQVLVQVPFWCSCGLQFVLPHGLFVGGVQVFWVQVQLLLHWLGMLFLLASVVGFVQ